jgi:surface protein
MFKDCESMIEITINDDNLEMLDDVESIEENHYDTFNEDTNELNENLFDYDPNLREEFALDMSNSFNSNISTIKNSYGDESIENFILDFRVTLFLEHFSNYKYMFHNCLSLKKINYPQKLNKDNIIYISGMFNNCESLKSLPDISNWNTVNVTDMNRMFNNCKLLKSLPDISKWNTNNVTRMSGMFSDCSSLLFNY